MIQTRLPHLKTFQFAFVYNHEKDTNYTLDSFLQPFTTPFWLHEKRWFVNCDYTLRSSEMTLYTESLCPIDDEIVIRRTARFFDRDIRLVMRRGSKNSDYGLPEQVENTINSSFIYFLFD